MVGGERGKDPRRGESCLTPGLCPPVKHLDLAIWARTIGLSRRTEMKGRWRRHQGKPEGNVNGQRLKSKIELKRGDYSSLRWATRPIIKDPSCKGLVVPGRRNKNVQQLHGSDFSHESGILLQSN